MQIGEEKKLLVSYKDQLVEQSALVARARQALGTSGSVSTRDDYSRQRRETKGTTRIPGCPSPQGPA